MDKYFITTEGYKSLKKEIENMKNVQRPKVIKQIAEAREHGDLKENAEYHAAKDKQGFIEAQLSDLEPKFLLSEVVDVKNLSGDIVQFGTTVELENLDNEKIVKYKIVSEFESDIDKGLISNSSPVAQALLRKKEGDEVEIRTPGGVSTYEILKITFV